MDVATRTADRARRVGRQGTGLVLVVLGLVLLVEALGDGPAFETAGPWLLLLAGGVVVASGVLGGSEGDGVGLVVLGGVVLGLVLLGSATTGLSPASGIGERLLEPTGTTVGVDGYDLLVGEQVLDLRGLDLAPGTHVLRATVGVGRLEVLLPAGADVTGTARVGTGSVMVDGVQREGVDLDVPVERGASGDAPRLELELRAWTGEVVVR